MRENGDTDFPGKLTEAAAYLPSRRDKARTRDRGWILASDLPRSPKADAVAADLLDRLAQHAAEDTLPRGPRGLFNDLRPLAFQATRVASPTPF